MNSLKAFTVFWVLVLSLAGSGEGAVTFTFDSQGPEAVGDGESGTYTDADGDWNVRGIAASSSTGPFVGMRLGFSHDDPGVEHPVWILEFMNEHTSELTLGTYTNLGSESDPTTASMEVSNDITCTGDDDPTNEFTVTEIEYDLYGRPIRFAASLILRCAPGQAPLLASIDYIFDGNLEAPGFTEGNIVASLDSILYEYTPGGTLVQVLPVGRGESPDTFFGLDRISKEPARDLAMSDGVLYLYNEQSNLGQFTFSDRLSRLSTLFPTGEWRHDPFDDEWNQSSTLQSGLTVLWPFVVVVDGPVSGDARGLVRFDTSIGYAPTRFYRDVAGGLDGQLYGLKSDGTTVEVFDPMTLANVGTVSLDTSVNAIAVDAAGIIFGVGGISEVEIINFGATGTTQDNLDLDADLGFAIEMMDVDISRSGQIIIGLSGYGSSDRDGEFIITEDTLTSWSLIEIDASPTEPLTFVGFVAPKISILRDSFESGDTSGWSNSVP